MIVCLFCLFFVLFIYLFIIIIFPQCLVFKQFMITLCSVRWPWVSWKAPFKLNVLLLLLLPWRYLETIESDVQTLIGWYVCYFAYWLFGFLFVFLFGFLFGFRFGFLFVFLFGFRFGFLFGFRFADWNVIWISQHTERGEVDCNHGDAIAFQFE